jgi:carbonic anhydrase
MLPGCDNPKGGSRFSLHEQARSEGEAMGQSINDALSRHSGRSPIDRIPGRAGVCWIVAVLAVATTAVFSGCATPSTPPAVISTIDKAQQAAITPDDALARLVDGNHRFVSGATLRRDYVTQMKATAGGQYPFAVVLSCIDSRSAPEIVFDQGIGDVFVARIAGNYANSDIMGSMEFATKLAGAKLVVVMGHTECGAVKGACDDVVLGNLTTVIQAIRPALDQVKDVPGERNSKNKQFVQAVAVANVRRTVAGIRAGSPILRDLEKAGQIKIVGAMHDIATGQVTFYPWAPEHE